MQAVVHALLRRQNGLMPRALPLSFYRRDTTLVARELIGCRLVHVVPGAGRLAGIIIETEAYVGAADAACHGFKNRRTARTESLFQDGGRSYVYFVYGMHWCFNVVTRGPNDPEAVLVRALRPTEGLERMRRNRSLGAAKAVADRQLCSGPAKLCDALEIDRASDRLNLKGPALFIEPAPERPRAGDIVACPRIGVDYAGEAAAWPLRFLLRDEPFVSKPPHA